MKISYILAAGLFIASLCPLELVSGSSCCGSQRNTCKNNTCKGNTCNC